MLERVRLIGREADAAADVGREGCSRADVVVGVPEQNRRHEPRLVLHGDRLRRSVVVVLRGAEIGIHDGMDIDREVGAEGGAPHVADADAAGEGRQEILAEPARAEPDRAGSERCPGRGDRRLGAEARGEIRAEVPLGLIDGHGDRRRDGRRRAAGLVAVSIDGAAAEVAGVSGRGKRVGAERQRQGRPQQRGKRNADQCPSHRHRSLNRRRGKPKLRPTSQV